jgi:hypothetical protein
MIAWTAGTASFFAGDMKAGLAYFDEAKRLLDARRDLRLWLRFHSISARWRLNAGILDGVPELLRTASVGLEILGNSHDVVELRQVEAKKALFLGEATEAARIMSAVLDDPVLGGPDISRGESEEILAEALLALGKHEAARERFRSAADHYEAEGRLKSALGAWRRSVVEEFQKNS